jgi:hypothetical protein
MANEINASASISSSKNGVTVSGSKAVSIDLSGNNQFALQQTIGTSDEAVGFPSDMTDRTLLFFQNLDASNYIELSLATGGSFAASVFAKLTITAPFAIIPSPAGNTTIYAKANTAACVLQVVAVGT